jgi:hypothetical protein
MDKVSNKAKRIEEDEKDLNKFSQKLDKKMEDAYGENWKSNVKTSEEFFKKFIAVADPSFKSKE